MKWRREDRSSDKFFKKLEWRKWFAWYPVSIDDENGSTRVWFEYVQRRVTSSDLVFLFMVYSYEYRILEKNGG